MNIKDLPTGSYTPIQPARLNIKNLPVGSYTPVEEESLKKDLGKRVQNFSKIAGEYEAGTTGLIPTQVRGAGEIAGAGLDIIKRATPQFVKDIGGAIPAALFTDRPEETRGDITIPARKAILPRPVIDFAGRQVQGIQERYKKYEEESPEDAKNLSAVGNIVGLGLAAETGVGIATKFGPKALKVASEQGKKIAGMPSAIKSTVKSKVDKIVQGKTLSEILATKEADLHRLNFEQRSIWFDNQKSQIDELARETTGGASENLKGRRAKIDEAYTATEQKVQADLAEKAAASEKEADELARELAVTSRDKVIELRPKIRKALGEQSQEYRRLVDEELAPHKNTPVFNDEIGGFIDEKYAANPDLAVAIRSKLGIKGTNIGENGLPTINVGEPNTTIGEIYERAKSLRQDIGVAARKSTRTYTPDEKLIDDSIAALSDFMRSKGVDLKQARQFWARYAPIRNQLVSESKPFLQVGTQTKTFANTLTRVAKEVDVNNENFINEVENILGESITKDLKVTVEKLSRNQKKALADKIELEALKQEALLAKKEAIQIARDEAAAIKAGATADKRAAIESLTRARIDVERRARWRKIIRWGITTVGAGSAIRYGFLP